MVKLRYFRHYIIIRIGDIISQTFWQYGGRTGLYRHEWVRNTELFYCFNIIINLANGLSFKKRIRVAVTQNFISIFIVSCDESKEEVGAVGGRSASMSGDTTVNPAAKGSSGKGIRQR